jgi:hypothetical protein
MKALEWFGQLLVFLVLYNLGHIIWWNVRKRFSIHPILVEFAFVILVMVLIWLPVSHWWMVILLSLAIGFLKGDWEMRLTGRS